MLGRSFGRSFGSLSLDENADYDCAKIACDDHDDGRDKRLRHDSGGKV